MTDFNPRADEGEVPATVANNHGTPMPVLQPETVKKLLDNMPGFIGGLDSAIRDHVGTPLPFVLLVFTGNAAAHAQNFDAKEANRLILHYADQIRESEKEGGE